MWAQDLEFKVEGFELKVQEIIRVKSSGVKLRAVYTGNTTSNSQVLSPQQHKDYKLGGHVPKENIFFPYETPVNSKKQELYISARRP